MAIQIGTAGSRITANAAAVATAMSGGTTTAEVQAIGALLTLCARRPDLFMQLAKLQNNKELTESR